MKRKINLILLLFIQILCLSSCFFKEFQEKLKQEYLEYIGAEVEYGFHYDTGNSIELLNNAFNGKVDNHNQSLIEEYSDTVLNIKADNRTLLNKNVNNLNSLTGKTPTTGNVTGLVIPVDFIDAPIGSEIYKSINPEYQSVSSYYYNSSYGQLNMSFDVLPWYRMSKHSKYYELLDEGYTGDTPGVSAIIHEVFKNININYDFSKYDSDNDGFIDCIYIIYSTNIDYLGGDFWWAYQYYNLDEIYYDRKLPFSYVFAGFNFLFEDDKTCNATTFIHETGHLLGLEDYYDYDDTKGFNKGGLGGYDMMDANIGDHNPFSKMSLGWVKNPQIANKTTTQYTLSSFNKTGDILMVCDNYDSSKGVFQNYFLIQYLDISTILNKNRYSLISRDGIRILRVNAPLKIEYEDGVGYEYYKYDNSYTNYNLLDHYINNQSSHLYSYFNYQNLCTSNNDLYKKGDSVELIYNNNQKSQYKIKIDALDTTNKTAIITITTTNN